eukprot:GILJ01001162.1.p1 GENE.GILJ01001162.1~~GILJ01001162.1.p1  ORF type:complete len:345 (+),score=58.92 GILJ01001162.1:95-1036(+)
MQDRLTELRRLAGQSDPAPKPKNDGDIELGNMSNDKGDGAGATGGAQSSFMSDYFRKIGAVKNSMNVIKANTERIRKLKDQAVRVTLPEQEKKISTELQQIIDETNVTAQSLKNSLEQMKSDNTEFDAKHKNTSESRIRANMLQTTTRKFKEYLQEYQKVQTEYKSKVRQKVERQIKIVEPNATQEEVDQVVQSGDVGSVFRSKIMEGAHEQLKNAVADIQDKYRDIRKLEQSVTELHQTFLDLALLVESQGEILDQIEYSVGMAKEYTEKAEKELIKAKKYSQGARKKMCCVIVILVIILIVILFPILKIGL